MGTRGAYLLASIRILLLPFFAGVEACADGRIGSSFE